MNQYQLEDILTATTQASVESFGIYLTLMAAYLVASYTAGPKLTLGQAVTVSVLFVVAALIAVLSTYGYLSRSIPLAEQLTEINPERLYAASSPALRNVLAIIEVIGIISSLLFMRSIRKSSNDDT